MDTQLNFDYSIVSEVQISYRSKVPASKRPKVSDSRSAYDVLMKIWDRDTLEYREEFHLMALNRSHKVIAHTIISQGGTTGTIADPKMIYQFLLKMNAEAYICAHNHPSGSLRPSQSDISLTRKLKQGGELLEIRLLDHLIVTTEGFTSMADEGLM
jgi:DNA repair protein RadC